jgi:hypothetical protein
VKKLILPGARTWVPSTWPKKSINFAIGLVQASLAACSNTSAGVSVELAVKQQVVPHNSRMQLLKRIHLSGTRISSHIAELLNTVATE